MTTPPAPPHHDAWWTRFHRWLMPDYPRRAALYWWVAVVLGLGVLGHSIHVVAQLPHAQLVTVAAVVVVALIAGLFPLTIPRSINAYAAGEIFIFLALLMSGPAAASVAAAAECAVGSWRASRRWTSRIISPAVAGLAMYATGSLLQFELDAIHHVGWASSGLILLATTTTAILYFMAVSVLLSAVTALKRRQWPSLGDMVGNLGWIGLSFAGSASIACLLFLSYRQTGVGVLVAAVPIIAMLLTALHGLFRQQESADSLRRSRLEAAEREAELSARHLRELELSERRFHSAFTHASIGMALVDPEGRIQQINPALCGLLGVGDAKSILGHPFVAHVQPAHANTFDAALARLRQSGLQQFNEELVLRCTDGGEVWAAIHGSEFSDSELDATRLILQVHDVTARRHAEAGLRQIAFHDSLTGLPNRRRFFELLTHALERTQMGGRGEFALLFLDFDRFKLINDSLGHAVGDEFLVAVARRLQQQVRPHDVVARLGGDEFAILAPDIEDGRSVVAMAERILESLRAPMSIAGTEMVASASIGITLSSMGYAGPDDMLRDADIAMYKAKNSGRGRCALFDSAQHTEVSARMRLEGELRSALSRREISVAYQPIVVLQSGKIVGFEALARWNHPKLGAIAPDVFIPIAEDSGQSVALSDLALAKACGQMKRWQREFPELSNATMHVNLSAQDIGDAGLIDRVTGALEESGLAADSLVLELTENILMDRLSAALPMLHRLRSLGVGLSIDDFGEGYTSLQHLASLPVTSLKVDAAFIRAMGHNTNEAAILKAIVFLGASLGKAIIAEGVETDSQRQQLQQMTCAYGQGYLFCHPLSPQAMEQFMRETFARTSDIVT